MKVILFQMVIITLTFILNKKKFKSKFWLHYLFSILIKQIDLFYYLETMNLYIRTFKFVDHEFQ